MQSHSSCDERSGTWLYKGPDPVTEVFGFCIRKTANRQAPLYTPPRLGSDPSVGTEPEWRSSHCKSKRIAKSSRHSQPRPAGISIQDPSAALRPDRGTSGTGPKQPVSGHRREENIMSHAAGDVPVRIRKGCNLSICITLPPICGSWFASYIPKLPPEARSQRRGQSEPLGVEPTKSARR